MQITVKLFATFRSYSSNPETGVETLDVAPGTQVAAVCRLCNIPEDIPKIVLQDGNQLRLDQTVQASDMLSIFPPIAGGCRMQRHGCPNL